jgi:hypothetical protein
MRLKHAGVDQQSGHRTFMLAALHPHAMACWQKVSLHDTDQSTLHGVRRPRAGETFVPVCLPGFNATAFLHAYVACLDPGSGVFLALLSGGSDAFHRLAGARHQRLSRMCSACRLRPLSRAALCRGPDPMSLQLTGSCCRTRRLQGSALS